MKLPPLPEKIVIDTHKPTGYKIRGYDETEMLLYGMKCREAVLDEIKAKIEKMKNENNH